MGAAHLWSSGASTLLPILQPSRACMPHGASMSRQALALCECTRCLSCGRYSNTALPKLNRASLWVAGQYSIDTRKITSQPAQYRCAPAHRADLPLARRLSFPNTLRNPSLSMQVFQGLVSRTPVPLPLLMLQKRRRHLHVFASQRRFEPNTTEQKTIQSEQNKHQLQYSETEYSPWKPLFSKMHAIRLRCVSISVAE